MRNIVVIGGGTGSFTVLSGIKKLKDVNITAIVASTDSGGSTGRLRDEFGHLPAGDIRQCLIALAENSQEQKILRDLFNYRFEKGETGLKGHNFGNLFMTAVRDIVGDELKSIELIEKLFNIKGKVYPSTLDRCDLLAEYENGKQVVGEHFIDEPEFPHDGRLHIKNLITQPKVSIHPKIKECIASADFIILGPGDLYTSLLANLVVDGMQGAILKSKAKVLYISNLVTKFGQTFEFKLSNFVNEIEKYLQKPVDFILHNNNGLPKEILDRYSLENAFSVENDMKKDSRLILADLLAREEIKTSTGDVLKRSLIRHDGDKIAEQIAKLAIL